MMAATSRRRRLAFAVIWQMYGVLNAIKVRKKRRKERTGRPWVLKHLLQRSVHGACATTVQYFSKHYPHKFATYARMPIAHFDWLLELVTPLIQKQDTNYRLAVSAHDRLYITLHFLAFGDSYRSMELLFLVGESTIGRFVPQVCSAIYTVLKDRYLKSPSCPDEWTDVANEFWRKWQLPNCLGALDGKHVQMMPPLSSGSQFYNYKHMFSVVMMALVDADYKFLYVDVGSNGRVCDGGVFEGCSLQKALERRSSMFPSPRPCPGDERPISYYVVADDAFGLQEHLMKPYSYREMAHERRIFNYRLSRGRRVVENAFGILANKWRIFLRKIPLQPSTVEKIVLASCAMHNMLREEVGFTAADIETETTAGVVNPVAWRQDRELVQAPFPAGTNTTVRARGQREYLVTYFSSKVGSVPWQDAAINSKKASK